MIKYDHTLQQSSSKGNLDQQETEQQSLSARVVENQQIDKKADVILTDDKEENQTSIEGKHSKNDVPVSLQPELTTEGGDVITSDFHWLQSGTKPTTGDVKGQHTNENEFSDKNTVDDSISVEEIHHKSVANFKSTTETQDSSTIVRQSHSNNTDMSNGTCESNEKVFSIVKPSPQECKTHIVDDNSVSSTSYPLQSDSNNEPQSCDTISYEEAEENTMFEELFGSSGEEEDQKEDDILEGAVSDDDDDDEMELGVACSEIEQRRVEEEFKRITTHSADVSHVSVSLLVYL